MMHVDSVFPGTSQHQSLLKRIVEHYQDDPRILAVIVFGSLGRGNWDAYSDLDLDVITTDDIHIDVLAELTQLCEAFPALGERAALIIPDGDDAGDLVLESLVELSIRYHPLALTSPNIIDTMQVLAGSLDHATIAAAGNANHSGVPTALGEILDRCLRYAVVANVAFQRKQIWSAVEILQRMRALLMEIFARTHGSYRWYQFFDTHASQHIQKRLGKTLPQYDLHSLQESLLAMLEVLERDLRELSNGQLELNAGQKSVLHRVWQAIESGTGES